MRHPFTLPEGAQARESTHLGGPHVNVDMPNGYGASIVCNSFSCGGPAGLWELAVIGPGGRLDYSTPITGDVEGDLSVEDVSALLARIAALPVPAAR